VTEPPAQDSGEPAAPARPTRAQRISAFAFLAAFGLTVLTVIATGLNVGSPRGPRRGPETQSVVLAVAAPQTVNLLFESRARYDDVEFTLDLPSGVELSGRAGVRRLVWRAPLKAGNNLLPLTLVARGGSGGQLAARLQHGGAEKTFVVDLSIGAR
jgi:hypothetical protein